MAEEEPDDVNIAIIGAERGHPLLADAIARLPSSFRRNRHLTNSDQTGPGFFASVLDRHPETLVFEAKLFYPYHWTEKWRKGQKFPDAFAVHHWAKSWAESEHQRIASTPFLRRISTKIDSKLRALALTAKK